MRLEIYDADEVDPKKELQKYWEPEDLIGPSDAVRRQPNPMAADTRANTFFSFSEPWEDYTVDEAKDPTCRFRLAEKYKHMAMRDVSEEGGDDGYDDYRIVVDLEISPSKVKDYKNKRGWAAVCELISPYHDEAIAAAGDDKHLIRESNVINEAFFGCVLAAPVPLQTRPIKTKEQAAAGGIAP